MFKTKTILLLMFFGLPFIFTSKAQADLFGDYVSHKTQKVEQRRTVGSGSRSNCQSNIAKNSISLLVPKQEVVHHTSLERPSFFLIANRFSSAESYDNSFKFTLVDPKTATTLVEKAFPVSEGIKQIELPKSTRLELGKVYLWYVAIPCANNQDEYREVLGAAVKRIKPSSQFETQLHGAKSKMMAATIYAKNGFWYEALKIAVEGQNREPSNGKVNHSDYLARLLHSAELNFHETAIHQTSK